MTAAGDPRERARNLMMAALDDEIDPEGRRELETLLAGDPELSAEWEELGRVKRATARLHLREPPAEVWERYWGSVYSRLERGVGWALASVGSILLLGCAAWLGLESMLGDPGLPLVVKVGVVAVTSGLIVLFVSVVREKLLAWRDDPYREVHR